jgi:hypothetical protein
MGLGKGSSSNLLVGERPAPLGLIFAGARDVVGAGGVGQQAQ